MALLFPNSPNDGDTVDQPTGVTYKWSAANSRWDVLFAPGSKGEFDAKLAGYASTGLHEEILALDLDTVVKNSTYIIDVSSGITNQPTDMAAVGFLHTYMYHNPAFGDQVIYGMNGTDVGKIWFRQKNATWSVWKLVVDGGAMTLRLPGYEDNGRHIGYGGDLNDIDFNSSYNITGSATNRPDGQLGDAFLQTFVYRLDTTFAVQRLYGMWNAGTNQYQMWLRSKASDVWQPWKLVVDQNIGNAMKYYCDVASNGTGTFETGMTVARQSAGIYVLTFDTPLAGIQYMINAIARTATPLVGVSFTSNTATDFQIRITDSNDTLVDVAFRVSVQDMN